jgi:zinc protease
MLNSIRQRRKQLNPPSRQVVMLTAVLATVLSSCATVDDSRPGSGPATGAGSTETLTTNAGQSYLYFPMPDAERTAVAITWHSDLDNLPIGSEALPRLGIALMLNGGAGGLAAEEIIADFEDLDAGSDLWVQPREITGFIVSPKIHIDKASEIANLVMTQPNFEKKWFDREKKVLIDSAAERDVRAAGLAWNLFREVTLGNHPYKRFWSLQPVDGIKSIKLDDVKTWHADAFSSNALTITVAGNAELETVNNAIDKVLTGMPDKERVPMREFAGADIQGQTILLHKPDVEKSVILVIGRLPPHTEEQDIPLQLGVGVLGWGKQSRLFKAVRTVLRASYGFGAGTWDMTRQHRVLHLSGEIETEKAQLVLNTVRSSYEKFRKHGVGLVEFPIAKKFYVQRVSEEMQKPSSVAYMMMDAKLNDFSAEYMPTHVSQVKAQKRSEVNQSIKQAFPEFDSMLKIIVTPDADAIAGACVITEIEQWENCE